MELADYEYTVAQKCEGKWRVLKWLMLGGYALFVGIYCGIAFSIGFPHIVAVLPIFLWMLIFFTYKYVKPEYKYVITEGNLTFFRVYGKKNYEVLKIKLCDAKHIVPLESAIEEIKEFDPKVTVSALPSTLTTDSYIILYNGERGVPSAFMFKATSGALQSLRFYNKSTVMSSTEV